MNAGLQRRASARRSYHCTHPPVTGARDEAGGVRAKLGGLCACAGSIYRLGRYEPPWTYILAVDSIVAIDGAPPTAAAARVDLLSLRPRSHNV